jgi:phytoene synthase
LHELADRHDCHAAIKTGSRTFHAASWLLPARVRDSAIQLYAFCRMADDAIDESTQPRAALADLQARLLAAYSGTPRAAATDRALARVVAQHRIPMTIPAALLEGFAWDAESRRYETMAELHAYCARVAGTVGVMMALLMGTRSPGALARAADLGVAMQLSNIARDVGEDARHGRLYLPLAWLREAGLDSEEFLRSPRFDARVSRVVEQVVDAARVLYERALPGIDELPVACRPAIHAARLMYAEIGEEVARRAGDSVSSRAVVSSTRKIALLLRALRAAVDAVERHPMPALPETQFLVDSVTAADELTDASAPSDAALSSGNTVTRVIEIFERLQARDSAFAARS